MNDGTMIPRMDPGEATMSGGEFARRLGVHRNTVLYWRRQGILLTAKQGHNGRPLYTEAQVEEYFRVIRERQEAEGARAAELRRAR